MDEKLKSLIEKYQKNTSVSKFCQSAGICRQTYYNWHAGTHPDFSTAAKIMDSNKDDPQGWQFCFGKELLDYRLDILLG